MADANQITLLNPLPTDSGYLNYQIVDNAGSSQTLDVQAGGEVLYCVTPGAGPWVISAWFYPQPQPGFAVVGEPSAIPDPNATVTLETGLDPYGQTVYYLMPVAVIVEPPVTG